MDWELEHPLIEDKETKDTHYQNLNPPQGCLGKYTFCVMSGDIAIVEK